MQKTNYFKNFERIISNDYVITNLLNRAKIRNLDTIIKSKIYEPYLIKDDETPESIAEAYYGSTTYIWIICFTNNIKNIKLYNFVSKNELQKITLNYDFHIVSLKQPIKGAFPSKIYSSISQGIPIIYFGKGAVSNFILKNNLGYAFDEVDFFEENLINCKSSYKEKKDSVIHFSNSYCNFDKQIDELAHFLREKL